MTDRAEAIAGAQKCLDDFMTAFNARDLGAWEATFNFPSIRLASSTLAIIDKPGWHPKDTFERGALAEWGHSDWERREVIHAGPGKVISTRASRATARAAARSVISTRSMWSRWKTAIGV
ncbi:MAG: hypothetical protein H5U13_07190 [Parvibaculum sp.]|nr:hypothetical protein [Parvibaculum sp.]